MILVVLKLCLLPSNQTMPYKPFHLHYHGISLSDWLYSQGSTGQPGPPGIPGPPGEGIQGPKVSKRKHLTTLLKSQARQ